MICLVIILLAEKQADNSSLEASLDQEFLLVLSR